MTSPDKRYRIIGNPAAGRGKGRKIFEATQRIFKSRGISFSPVLTTGPGDASRIASASVSHYDVIVGIGGDGTLHEILRGIVHSGKPLAVVPAGSGNDFAKCLNLPKKLDEQVDCILMDRYRVADAGRFNKTLFINGVGIGFDAAVNHNTKNIEHLRGLSGYFWAMLKTLSSYRPVKLKITMDGVSVERETFLVAIGNGSACGGGFKLNPFARIDDHLLDINILDPVSVPVLLWHLPKVFLGTIGKTKYATMNKTAKIEIESDAPFPVHIDGEAHIMESGLHKVEVIPNAVKVIGNF